MNDAYLLLGSNLGSRESYIHEAKLLISDKVGKQRAESSLYETAPWGTDNPAPFLNQVIHIQTSMGPNVLLASLLEIESVLGRTRGNVRNQPRTIDIDILFFNNWVIREENLTIPHERLHERRFVLTPLVEIAPDLLHPVLDKTMRELLDICKDTLWVKQIS